MAEIEMVIDSIRETLNDNLELLRVVILKEKSGERYLPIGIGGYDQEAIFMRAYDLICSICYAVELKVKRVIINKLKDDTYFAKLVLASRDKSHEIDFRTSDALAVAVRLDAPIFADEKVLNKAGVRLDPETGRPISET